MDLVRGSTYSVLVKHLNFCQIIFSGIEVAMSDSMQDVVN